MNNDKAPKILTGRKVTLFLLAGFGTIICANLALVYSAVGSFPGLETRKPYVESLNFEARRIAQEKLNWTSDVYYENKRIFLELHDDKGKVVTPTQIELVVGRATTSELDENADLYFAGNSFVADIELSPGNWQVKIKATAADGTEFSRTLPLYIKDVT